MDDRTVRRWAIVMASSSSSYRTPSCWLKRSIDGSFSIDCGVAALRGRAMAGGYTSNHCTECGGCARLLIRAPPIIDGSHNGSLLIQCFIHKLKRGSPVSHCLRMSSLLEYGRTEKVVPGKG